MTEKFTVYLVDDDPGALKALSRLLRAKGHDVKPYSSPQYSSKSTTWLFPAASYWMFRCPVLMVWRFSAC